MRELKNYVAPVILMYEIKVEECIASASVGTVSFGDIDDNYTPSVEGYEELGGTDTWSSNRIFL